MKSGSFFVFFLLVSSFSLSELSAKGGKDLILDLAADERGAYCTAMINTKLKEIDELNELGGLSERVDNLMRQVNKYLIIKEYADQADTKNDMLAALISTMNTDKSVKSNTHSKEENNLKVEKEKEEKKPIKNISRLRGEQLINEAGKFLIKQKNIIQDTILIDGIKYTDLKQARNTLLLHQEQLQHDNDGVLPVNNPYANQIAKLEQDEKRYINKLDELFPDAKQTEALAKEFKLSNEDAEILLKVIMFAIDMDDKRAVEALY